MYGQFMKFIKAGAVHINSDSSLKSLPNIAFKNPDDSLVLVVVDDRQREQDFSIIRKKWRVNVELDAKSIAIFPWK
jgi:O-glycosyl hydrolase